MNLHRKAILLVVSIMCLTFLASHVTSNLVVFIGFEKLENADVKTQLIRATNALNSEIACAFTTKAKGMGFGLANCRRIIEAHKGKISVESIVNIGTSFKNDLPMNLRHSC